MHTCSTSHLSKSANRFFNLAWSSHHQIGKLINSNNYSAHFLFSNRKTINLKNRLNQLTLIIFHRRIFSHIIKITLNKTVIGINILAIIFRKNLVSLQHLINSPSQSTGSLFRIRNHRYKQMRNTLILRKFNHLRVNQQKLYFIRRSLKQNTHKNRVHANRFTGACSTCNKQVRHFSKVSNNNFA